MLSFFDPHDETGWKQPRVIEMGAFEGRGFLEGDGAFAVNVNSIQGGGETDGCLFQAGRSAVFHSFDYVNILKRQTFRLKSNCAKRRRFRFNIIFIKMTGRVASGPAKYCQSFGGR